MLNEERKGKVLIVDDAPTNIKMIRQVLKQDVKTTFATNGPDALKIVYSENPPDIILLDIVMPGMDGYEVCRKIKQDKRSKNIPIIFISSKNDAEDEIKGLEIGAVDYITKPFNSAIVKARVLTHLELKHHRDFLENLSSLDGLTRIHNRRKFNNFIDLQWRQATRHGKPLSLLIADIDFFRLFNNEYGHQTGDECLKRVAHTLANSLKRALDLVARYGGEEFACVLPSTDFQGTWQVAQIMRQEIIDLSIPHVQSQAGNHVTISIGLATVTPKISSHFAILLEAAENQLHYAKNAGRNCIKGIDLK